MQTKLDYQADVNRIHLPNIDLARCMKFWKYNCSPEAPSGPYKLQLANRRGHCACKLNCFSAVLTYCLRKKHILTSNLDTLCLLNCLPKENSENHLTAQKRDVRRYTPVFCPIRWKCSKWKSMVLRSTCRKLYCSPQNHCVSNWWAKRWQEKEPETWLPLQQQVDADPEDLWTRLPLPNGTNGIALCNVVDPNRGQSCKAERPWGKRGHQASKKDSGKAWITDTAVENVGLWPIVYQKKKQNWWSTWNGKIHLCKIVYRKA